MICSQEVTEKLRDASKDEVQVQNARTWRKDECHVARPTEETRRELASGCRKATAATASNSQDVTDDSIEKHSLQQEQEQRSYTAAKHRNILTGNARERKRTSAYINRNSPSIRACDETSKTCEADFSVQIVALHVARHGDCSCRLPMYASP